MRIARLPRGRAGRWLVGWAFWTILALSFATQFYVSGFNAGMDISWRSAVAYALADWYVFALLSIPAAFLARRFSLGERRWKSHLALHLGAGVLFSLAYMLLRAAVGQWQSGASFADALRPLAVKTWHFNLLIYWVIVVAAHAFEYSRKLRERELHASELEKMLAQAKLHALQMQLNPHFLFNTLHSISSLMHSDVEAADRMLMRLSHLLRAALDSSETQEVALREELRLLDLYLGIEQIRFGDRLVVQKEVAADVLDAMVPNLILQPLVENAIKHGIEPRARRGTIRLEAKRSANGLQVEIIDDGGGPRAGNTREGVGLSNTRARLRELYGSAHDFFAGAGRDGGFRAAITIPFRTASA